MSTALEDILQSVMIKLRDKVPFESAKNEKNFRRRLRKRLEVEISQGLQLQEEQIVEIATKSRQMDKGLAPVEKAKRKLFTEMGNLPPEPSDPSTRGLTAETVPETPETKKTSSLGFYGKNAGNAALNVSVKETPLKADVPEEVSSRWEPVFPNPNPYKFHFPARKAPRTNVQQLEPQSSYAVAEKRIVSSSSSEDDDCRDCCKLKRRNTVLNVQNMKLKGEVTNLRHKEALHVRTKLHNQLSGRAVKIVDNAVFTSTMHSSDRLVDDLPIDMINELSLTPVSGITAGQFSSETRLFSTKGELVLGKSYIVPSSHEELRLCYHELQILKLIGNHVNIMAAIGLYMLDGKSYSVFTYVEKTLQTFLLKGGVSSWQAECLVDGVSAALQHISQKVLLIHTLSTSSVLVLKLGAEIRPLLTNFQLACRLEVALPWTDSQLKKFATRFIAPEIRAKKAPTQTSDVYSYGLIVQDILNCCTLPERITQAYRQLVKRSVCDSGSRLNINALVERYIMGNEQA